MKYVTNSRQVIVPHGGHLMIGLEGIECVDQIEEQFLSTGDPQKIDVGCLDKIHRKPFAVPLP